MTALNLVGVLGTVLNVWGNLLIAAKSSRGWWVRIACNLVWILHGALVHNSPVILNAVVFLGINVYGIVKWRRRADALCPCAYCDRFDGHP